MTNVTGPAISTIRKDFSVFLIERDALVAKPLIETLRGVGYVQSKFYPTLAMARAMIEAETPHAIVVDHEAFGNEIEAFLNTVKNESAETKVILMTPARRYLEGLQYVSHELAYDVILRPLASALDLVQKLDRACEYLYLTFENEQLREHLHLNDEKSRPRISTQDPASSSTPPADHQIDLLARREAFGDPSIEYMHGALEKLAATKDLEQTVQIFAQSLSQSLKNMPIAYFKYVPAHMSLLYSQSAWLPNEKFRGLGIDLKKEDPAKLGLLTDDPAALPVLKTMIEEVFHRSDFTAFSFINDGEMIGVFVLLGRADVENDLRLNIYRRAFEMAYKRNQTIKEKHGLEIFDPLTGLANRKEFSIRLEQEMARSRRILMPLSLITLDIDGFGELNKRVGAQQADSVLKTIATILRRTTRLNDVLARTGPDEFSCLLPHTGHDGAAIKAERLRILIHSTRVPLLEGLGLGPLTVSVGVSEYPSLCNDAEGLVSLTDEALQTVKGLGGNRVCLAAPPTNFKMDFVPYEVGESSRFAARGLDGDKR